MLLLSVVVCQVLIGVYNYENDGSVNGPATTAPLCADVNGPVDTQLGVRLCELPPSTDGPYWILYFNESSGLSLVSGGAPDVATPDGYCRTGEGESGSGLWIFTREQVCVCSCMHVCVCIYGCVVVLVLRCICGCGWMWWLCVVGCLSRG